MKSRSIQDCLSWEFEYIHQCNQFQLPFLILKSVFTKAFDTIEHDVSLQILQHKRFSTTWIGWVKELLTSGSSSILPNGVPGKQFYCRRGLRQGDPPDCFGCWSAPFHCESNAE